MGTRLDMATLTLPRGDVNRLPQIERALVKRAADDAAPDRRAVGPDGADVIDVPHAAAGDDRHAAGLGESSRLRDVGALEHAVLGDVGVEDGGDGPVGNLLR